MPGSALRVLVGVLALTGAAAVPVVGMLTTRSPQAVSSEPSEELRALLNERGIRLFDGTPGEQAQGLRSVVLEGNATDVNDLLIERGSIKTTEGVPFNGYVVDMWPSEAIVASSESVAANQRAPRSIYAAFDGAPVGPAVSFYPDGQIERVVSYLNGQLSGQFIEYYPDGSLRLRAVAAGRSVNGGTEVRELSFGRHTPNSYTLENLGTGRLQFIGPGGSTTGENETRTPDEYAAFMLFEHGWFGRQNQVTADSRTLLGPVIEAQAASEATRP